MTKASTAAYGYPRKTWTSLPPKPVGRSAGSMSIRPPRPIEKRQCHGENEERQADPALLDEVGRRDEGDQPRAEVGDRNPDQHDDPRQGAGRHPGQQQLLALRHAPEEQQRRPAEDELDQSAELPAEERDQRRKNRHARSLATGVPCRGRET